MCAAGWAIVAADMAAAAHNIATRENVSLSYQQILSCFNSSLSKGCRGGWHEDAYTYIQKNGLATDVAYPFNDMFFNSKARRQAGPCRRNMPTSVSYIKSWTNFTTLTSEGAMLSALANGPIAAAVYAGPGWSSYAGGVYSKDCMDASKSPNHAGESETSG
jgi:cathepsin L